MYLKESEREEQEVLRELNSHLQPLEQDHPTSESTRKDTYMLNTEEREEKNIIKQHKQ